MGGSDSVPAPQQYYQPEKPLTTLQQAQQYKEALPLMLQMQKEYGGQFNDWTAAEQKRLSPNQYALNESLAQQALTGSQADLPALMKQSALDTFRSEIGSNVGSPIGAEYTSRNLAQLGEQYRNNYQNMGLSLLNKFPTQTTSPATSDYSLAGAANNQMQGYGAYQNALANSYYQQAPKSGGFNFGGALGMGAAGALAGGMMTGFNPLGIAAGGLAGGYMGSR